MTERDFGWNRWIAIVVNVNDPDQSGRVQIRIIGRQDDTENIKDDDLHWAIPKQSITSAAYGKIGNTPLGLVKGSKVYGEWFDKDCQLPIITGSLGKAGDPKEGGDSSDGIPEIDIKKGSIPGAAQNFSDPTPNYPFSNLYGSKIDINQINNGDGGKTIATYTPATGVDNKFAVDSKLKEPKKPTTASAKKEDKSDVLDIVKQVDPDKLSRVLPDAVDGFAQVEKIMSMTSPAGLTKLLSGGIQGAIGDLAKSIGLKNVLGPLTQVLNSAGLPPIVQNALRSALSNVMKTAMSSGGKYNHSAVSRNIPQVNPKIGSPTANLIVAVVADTFVQQYYPLEREPYPGYIEWKDPITNRFKYTIRGVEPHYSSAQEHIQGNSSRQLINSIGPVLTKLSQGGSISPADITKIAAGLTGGHGAIAADALSKVLGKGVDLKSITKLASKLIPGLAAGIEGIMGGHLPKSVLDAGKVGAAMNDYTKNQSLLAMKKKEMKKAVVAEPAEQQDAQIKAYNDAQATANEPGFSGATGTVLTDALGTTNNTDQILKAQDAIQGTGPNSVGSPYG